MQTILAGNVIIFNRVILPSTIQIILFKMSLCKFNSTFLYNTQDSIKSSQQSNISIVKILKKENSDFDISQEVPSLNWQKAERNEGRCDFFNLKVLREAGFVLEEDGKDIIMLDVSSLTHGHHQEIILDSLAHIIRAESQKQYFDELNLLERGYSMNLQNCYQLLSILKEKELKQVEYHRQNQSLEQHISCLRQELQQLYDAKQILESELQEEKQELSTVEAKNYKEVLALRSQLERLREELKSTKEKMLESTIICEDYSRKHHNNFDGSTACKHEEGLSQQIRFTEYGEKKPRKSQLDARQLTQSVMGKRRSQQMTFEQFLEDYYPQEKMVVQFSSYSSEVIDECSNISEFSEQGKVFGVPELEQSMSQRFYSELEISKERHKTKSEVVNLFRTFGSEGDESESIMWKSDPQINFDPRNFEQIEDFLKKEKKVSTRKIIRIGY